MPQKSEDIHRTSPDETKNSAGKLVTPLVVNYDRMLLINM